MANMIAKKWTYLSNYWMDGNEIWHKYLWLQDNESKWLLWSPHISFNTTIKLTYVIFSEMSQQLSGWIDKIELDAPLVGQCLIKILTLFIYILRIICSKYFFCSSPVSPSPNFHQNTNLSTTLELTLNVLHLSSKILSNRQCLRHF